MENKMGTGSLQMEDILKMDKSKHKFMFRNMILKIQKMKVEMGDSAKKKNYGKIS